MAAVHPDRIRRLNQAVQGAGPVVYWMSRDQRVDDNWALIHAADMARQARVPLHILFCLTGSFGEACIRQYDFMMQGLVETWARARERGLCLRIRPGHPPDVVRSFARACNAGLVVTDFDPLRIKQEWKRELLQHLDIPVHEVDAHNIVPVWRVSDKQEYAARTIRPRIQRLLAEFLEPFPVWEALPEQDIPCVEPDGEDLMAGLEVDRTVLPVAGITPGYTGGMDRMHAFMAHGLDRYDRASRDPNANGLSRLSPWLHFGQIAAQRVVLEAVASPRTQGQQAFLEQIIIRRELADNYCLHNPHYDSLEGIPAWGRATLDKHRHDVREYVYSTDALEKAATHDSLWNAAQQEMRRTGIMHGYMRMYWAKKILEWSKTPEDALATAIRLNDRYGLDGRDPNGYVGVLWSMGGLHDRPWKERPVFGTVRFMSADGCKRKFDVHEYIGNNSP
nr:deoxyribodipyrimidine photo-lyase [Desulfoplanes formicivorans]